MLDKPTGARAFRDDRGDVSSALLLMPAALLAVYVILHIGLLFHARQVAQAAAQEGMNVLQTKEGDPAEAEKAARDVVGGSGFVASSTEDAKFLREGKQAWVRVDVQVSTPMLPGLDRVTVIEKGPAERFVPEVSR